jgi:hypothetical protein
MVRIPSLRVPSDACALACAALRTGGYLFLIIRESFFYLPNGMFILRGGRVMACGSEASRGGLVKEIQRVLDQGGFAG